MAIEGVRIGPFIGGLNTASDPTTIGDTDVAVLENFELDPDGALVSRPPIMDRGTNIPDDDGISPSLSLIGYFVTPAGATYMLAHNGKATYYYTGTSWVKIADFPAAAMTQYRDKAWLVAPLGSTASGGSWNVEEGFKTVSAMPKGAAIVSHKERLWIALGPNATENGSRLYYSEVGAPNEWPGGGNFLNVNAGDGQNIVAMHLYYNDLLVFKTRSTYRFAYSAAPDTGVVSKVSETVGAATSDSIVAHESSLYVVFSDKVYEVVNFNFNQINNKVPLKAETYSAGLNYSVSISVWSDRLFVNYYGITYVYGLNTSTWTVWKPGHDLVIGKLLAEPITVHNGQPRGFIADARPNKLNLFDVSEELSISRTEPIECVFVSKNYDYQSSHTFKRLTWWGVDVIARQQITGLVTPIVHSPGVTWDQLRPHTWDELNTWDRPLDISIEITDQVAVQGESSYRKFVKMLKSLRFRQVNFKILITTDGTPSTAPVKIFSITTFVGVKERVSKKVS